MERKEEKEYTTGEFAKYFGIKKDTLFYYDKIKLFCPAGVHNNGYRYYISSQIATLWTLLSLREIGVSIKTLQEYFIEPSPKQLYEIAEKQLHNIDMEILKLKKIKRILTDISSATTEAIHARLKQIKIETLPDIKFIYSKENDKKTNTSNKEWENIYDNFVRENCITGVAYVGSVISREDLINGYFRHVYKLFTVSHSKNGIVRKGGQYAVFYHKGSYDSIPMIYPYILDEIKRLGFIITGDAYEEYLISETATKHLDDYITKIVIKISPH